LKQAMEDGISGKFNTETYLTINSLLIMSWIKQSLIIQKAGKPFTKEDYDNLFR
jgi:hypothetical protein